MSKEQQSWSKNTSLYGPFKGRQEVFNRSPQIVADLYGTIIDIRGEESYDEEFTSNLQIKMTFDKGELNKNYSDLWFPFDIEDTEFYNMFGNIDSAKIIISEQKVRAVLNRKNLPIESGRASLAANLKQIYSKGERNEAYSLSNLMTGISSYNTKRFTVWKPQYSSDKNTGITGSDKRIHIAATGNRFIELTENGISFSGPINFQMNPSQQRYGGFVSPPDFYRGMIPSTPVTPNPTYLPSLPIETITSLIPMVEIFMSLMV